METPISVDELGALIDTCLSRGVRLSLLRNKEADKLPDARDLAHSTYEGYMAALSDVMTVIRGDRGALASVISEGKVPDAGSIEASHGAKRGIKATEVLADVRAGMSNAALMKKYRVSSEALTSVFDRLMDAKVLSEEELDHREPLFLEVNTAKRGRRIRRCQPVLKPRISNMVDASDNGYVGDMSELGLQVLGMKAVQGETKAFRIHADAFLDTFLLSLEARCKWVKPAVKSHPWTAGFEITSIANDDLEELRRLIAAITFCDGTS
jgi:hypothetical protein